MMNNTFSRPKNSPDKFDSGPYEAIVVSHLDPKYMGGLQVELLKTVSSTNVPSTSGMVFEVKYLSPFYGITPASALNNNDGYENSQKSYGMWFIPPDIGTRVLVIFAEGNPGMGYWIGCIPDQYMNFMLPGYPSTQRTTNGIPGLKYPTSEYNKNITQAGNQPTVFRKPVHKELSDNLEQQGLLEDETRGTTTSSARREVPSSVFGISTPGPVDKRQDKPKESLGLREGRATMFTNRLGGSSFVMDDGDDKLLRKGSAADSPSEYVNVERGQRGGDPTLPHNELVRLRTRTGHQILLHNTEDLIYISNARGTAWIELTSNGKIDIYSQDSISVHSAQDLNFTADRDINFTAFENVNFVIGKELKVDTGESISITSGDFIASNASTSITSNANTFISNYAVETITNVAQTSNYTVISGDTINLGAKGEIALEADGNIKTVSLEEIHSKATKSLFLTTDENLNVVTKNTYITSDTNTEIVSGGKHLEKATKIEHNNSVPKSADPATLPPVPSPVSPVPPLRAAQVSRVPQHEPWYEHENLNPLNFTPDRTRAGLEQTGVFVPKVFDTFDTRPDLAVEESVIETSTGAPFDATRAPRTVEPGLPRATNGTPEEPLPAFSEINVLGSDTQAYINAIGQRESSNAYDAVNTLGYVGRFQFGAAALKDTGYISLDASNKNSSLNDPANWTVKDGINSLEDFLAAKEIQEKAMVLYTEKNYKYLLANGGISSNDDKKTIAGMLAGSHLLGAGGMKKWRRGSGGRDAYGTTGDEYFNIGSNSVA